MIQTNNNIPLYAQTPPGINLLPQQIHNTNYQPSIYHNPIPVVPVQGPFEFPVFANYQPVIKKDTINNNKFIVSHANLNNIKHIYQDILPNPKNPELGHFALISDRLNIYEYFEIVFGSNYSVNNNNDIDNPPATELEFLLGRIKINGYNSYFTNSTDNVISSMIRAPPNFFMFNICYPIFINENNKNIECNVNSQKGNMRVYKILTSDINIQNKIKDEVRYYKDIRDIIKTKVCPNFVLSYGMVVGNYTIDWNNIAYMKNEIPKSSDNSFCLVNLTESISQNIINWASPVINTKDANDVLVTIMTNTGSKNLNKWKNILFQLLVAIYILIKKDIIFNNFSLENNVYIKSIGSGIFKYWKYIINNVEYFVPNHGYLVMIDSNFKHSNIGLKNLDNTFKFGNLFGNIRLTGSRKDLIDKINVDLTAIDTEIAAKIAAGAAGAGAGAAGAGAAGAGAAPPANLSGLPQATINTLINFITEKLIYIIVSNFHEYISDDVGKMFNEEDLNLNYNKMLNYNDFKPGDLVILNKQGTNVVSIFKEIDTNTNVETIITNWLDVNRYGIDQNDIRDYSNASGLITKIIIKTNSKDVIETYKVN
jgi:hypothetical protein